MSQPPPADDSRASALSLLREHPGFTAYLGCRFLSMIAWQIVSVTVGWLIYERTSARIALGMVGLVQFVPALVFSVIGGVAADRYERRSVLSACYVALIFIGLGLAFTGLASQLALPLYYTLLALLGVVRAFSAPAGQAIIPALVPRERLAQAVALGSVLSQSAFFLGPSLAGLLIERFEHHQRGTGAHAFTVAAGLFVLVTALLRLVPKVRVADADEAPGLEKLMKGLRFVYSNKPILGALSLDLFAVLFGGVTALLPVFAKDILDRGPSTFGLLRAAPGAGALAMATLLLFVRIRRRAGLLMFVAVFVFGVATVVFAFSSNLALSLAALAAVGAADVISVVVRSTLIQLWSPDAMRGRISAVNLVFISSSNELGEFESGVAAEWWGPRRAAAIGGIITCGIVLLWMRMFPALRRTESLERET